MKNLLLIFAMFISSIAFAQDTPCNPEIQEDCSEVPDPVVFDFACPNLTCDDNVTFAVADLIPVYSNLNNNPTTYAIAKIRSNGSVLLNGNYPTPGRYWTNPNENALLDGVEYISATGFTIDIGPLGVIECILLNL